ncbi:serine hydrolase [Deinococcus sp.]|uniref:serine hydrolase n=1 Tax=Deinococcus sp. TaxID=47478 RepID=UPI002869A5BC|nr:serine hydrolase [Deinococcus sp.]
MIGFAGAWLTAVILIGDAAPGVPAGSAGPRAPQVCGETVSPTLTASALPRSVTGRVAFYAAEYEPSTLRVLSSIGLGALNEVYAVASTYKPLVVELALRDVDTGRLKLNTVFTTTAANRSIEVYPPGRNTLATLAKRAIVQSDNTAGDILQQAVGTQRVAVGVRWRSPCTSVLLTGKAAWAAQGSLQSAVLGDDLPAGAQRYAALAFGERLATATRLNANAATFTGPEVERAIDPYFRGPLYDPRIDLAVQHTSTAKAYADLVARVYGGNNLKPATSRLFRGWLSEGCCHPKTSVLKVSYWGAKAGSGWRLLTLTGLVETPDGRTFAYAYLNDGSDTLESEDMEAQIPAVVAWIERNLLTLAGR